MNGISRAVEPKVFDLIVYLIRNRERVVTRQEIFDQVWKGRLVSDATLSNHINVARKALDDDGQRQQVIKTVHGRGYQFIARIEELTEDLIQAAVVDSVGSVGGRIKHRRMLIAIALIVVIGCTTLIGWYLLHIPGNDIQEPASVGEPKRSPTTTAAITGSIPNIAVLPFNAIGNKEYGFLVDGLHEDLLTRLAKLEAFKVISRTSMMEYVNTTKSMRQIGEELGVDYILEGGVQTDGKRIRINAQLIDARGDEHLWAETYDRSLTAEDLFDIQADVALAIANQLKTNLSKADRVLVAELPTHNTEAYSAYLRGLEIWTKSDTIDNRQAVEAAFEEAVQLDPSFAAAWARLSQARSNASFYTTDKTTRKRFLESAHAALKQARRLQPDLFDTIYAWSRYLRMTHRYEEALEVLDSLGKQGDFDANVQRRKGVLNWLLGRYDVAYQKTLEAQRLDPRNVWVASGLIFMALANSDCKAAGWHAQAALELVPDSADVRANAAMYELSCTGNVVRSVQLLEDVDLTTETRTFFAIFSAYADRNYTRVLEISYHPTRGYSSCLPIQDLFIRYDALHRLGREEEAAAVLDESGDLISTLERKGEILEDPIYPETKAWYYALRGDIGSTRHWISRIERHKDYPSKEREVRYFRALFLTIIGQYDEAIEELRVLLKRPGLYTFRLLDALPHFDVLKDHPGYIEFRELYEGSPK